MMFSNNVRNIIGAFVLLLLLSLGASAYEQVGIFKIQAPDRDLFERTRISLLDAKANLERLLGEAITDTIRVFIAANRYDFDTAAFGGIPDWGVGVAIPSRNYISVLSPSGKNMNMSFEMVIRHELAHVAINKRVDGKRIPRFMDEGFAMMFAHQWGFGDDITIATAQVTGSLYELWEIDAVNMLNSSQARIAYAESYLAVKYIFDVFGKDTFQSLLDGFRKGQDRNTVFRNVLGTDFAGFDKMFADHLKSNYHWIMIITNPIVLWIGVVLLFLLGFILIKKRNKDIYKKWEEEEKLQSTDFDYEESSPWD
ncbi:MAG: LPXTG cell wall anchor domain-containing protein [candidate division Zixibacteria bacterium]|nr:LPXTG cell wall anchor domain-containing protein [candidate division Zixibacteria bacterium]NIR62529.1 LPXTG cell wall anchor domain-containing protein [candidate division Zixibacteria bacterium]NIS14772.1 LPXTG cell wall anchor domain-containing protein [candidate division Zixibacteria bacterium]NIS46922.1 LPXTG cell wall anchor domain-containing protein [candidate division Zixibacteria bacterium]NIT51311.1 LPXTG cell wall anchor domain-containing protein [candidate division Zixibacteria ba